MSQPLETRRRDIGRSGEARVSVHTCREQQLSRGTEQDALHIGEGWLLRDAEEGGIKNGLRESLSQLLLFISWDLSASQQLPVLPWRVNAGLYNTHRCLHSNILPSKVR